MGSILGLRRSPGGGKGNPLQYSCLENPMDRGAWRGTLHEVGKSRTRLSDRPHAHNTYGYLLSLFQYIFQSIDAIFSIFSPSFQHHFGQSEGKRNKYNLNEDSYTGKRQSCLTPLTSPRSGASGRRCWCRCRGRGPCRGEVWLEVQEIAGRFRSAERQVSFYNQIFEILKCRDVFQIKTQAENITDFGYFKSSKRIIIVKVQQ